MLFCCVVLIKSMRMVIPRPPWPEEWVGSRGNRLRSIRNLPETTSLIDGPTAVRGMPPMLRTVGWCASQKVVQELIIVLILRYQYGMTPITAAITLF